MTTLGQDGSDKRDSGPPSSSSRDERVPRTMAPSLAAIVTAIIEATPRKRPGESGGATNVRRSIFDRLWNG